MWHWYLLKICSLPLYLFWNYDQFLQFRNINLMPTLFKEAKMGVKLLKKRLGVTDVSFVKTVISIYWSPKHGDENLQVFAFFFFCFFLFNSKNSFPYTRVVDAHILRLINFRLRLLCENLTQTVMGNLVSLNSRYPWIPMQWPWKLRFFSSVGTKLFFYRGPLRSWKKGKVRAELTGSN